VHAIHHQGQLVDGQRELRVRIWRHLHRPVVGADHHRVLADQELRGFYADAGAGLDVLGVVLAVELVPAGVDQDGIARLQRRVLLLERPFEVLDRDLVGVGQRLDALEGGDVDQHAAREEHAGLLDAELGEAAAGRDLVGLEAIVVAVLVRLVGKPSGGCHQPSRNHELLVRPTPVGERSVKVRLTLRRSQKAPRRGHLSLRRAPARKISPVMRLTAYDVAPLLVIAGPLSPPHLTDNGRSASTWSARRACAYERTDRYGTGKAEGDGRFPSWAASYERLTWCVLDCKHAR
jgi:hypothetical protein